jgi:hypothetical protein
LVVKSAEDTSSLELMELQTASKNEDRLEAANSAGAILEIPRILAIISLRDV